MVKKQIQPHDFENGGPVKQTTINFNEGSVYNTTFTLTDTTANTVTLGGDVGGAYFNGITITASDTTISGNLNVNGILRVSPSDGNVYVDTNTGEMLVYSGGEWVTLEGIQPKIKKPSLFRRFINLFTK